MMVICIKKHLSNIWSLIHAKVKQHWGWDEKSIAYKKKFVFGKDIVFSQAGRTKIFRKEEPAKFSMSCTN